MADHFFDWSDLPAVLYNIEKNTSCLDDRMQKARLNGNPGSVKVDTDTVSSGDDAFVRDGRLDGSSGAPNTIAELVVELLVSSRHRWPFVVESALNPTRRRRSCSKQASTQTDHTRTLPLCSQQSSRGWPRIMFART